MTNHDDREAAAQSRADATFRYLGMVFFVILLFAVPYLLWNR